MKCPTCNTMMELVKKDASSNANNERKYDRYLYKCEKDDVRVSVEIPPLESASKIN